MSRDRKDAKDHTSNKLAGKAIVLIALLFVSFLLNAYLIYNAQRIPSSKDGLILPLGYKAFEWPRSFGNEPLVGAIVEIAPNSGFEYVSHLSKCGITSEVLEPSIGIIHLPSISRSIGVSSKGELSVDKFTADIEVAGKTSLYYRTGSISEKYLKTGDVVINAVENADTVSKRCGKILNKPNVYWISHALESSNVQYIFNKSSNYDAGTDSEGISNIADRLGLNVTGASNMEGELVVTVPAYIGFKGAYPIEILTGETYSFSGNEGVNAMKLGDDVYEQHNHIK